MNSSAERKRFRRSFPSTAIGGRSTLHLAELAALPLAPEKGVQVPVAEALDRLGHLALERETPHLAVGDDVDARVLLEPKRLVDGGVLDRA